MIFVEILLFERTETFVGAEMGDVGHGSESG